MFTDNTTTEAAYQNGALSSPEFFELVIRLRKLELYSGLRLHIIHITGMCIIEQVTDILSQGDQLEGVPSGVNVLNFLPIHDSALCP